MNRPYIKGYMPKCIDIERPQHDFFVKGSSPHASILQCKVCKYRILIQRITPPAMGPEPAPMQQDHTN